MTRFILADHFFTQDRAQRASQDRPDNPASSASEGAGDEGRSSQ